MKRIMQKFRLGLIVLLIASLGSPTAQAAQITPGLSDEALLDLIQKKSFDYFIQEVNKRNGLVPDRAHNFIKGKTRSASSIAAVGFALSVYPVAVERGWLDYATAYALTRRTLQFFLEEVPHEKGFFYHFINMNTGERASRSELSPIDTALLIAGALFAAEYFEDEQLYELANALYERIDFEWMLNKGDTLALAWAPESGFSRWRWDHYNEAMILYLLAIGSPTHPIPVESWAAMRRPVGSYKGHRLIQMAPLFTHQYSHIWVDFKNKNDGFADYFQNSVQATLANRQFCIDQSSKFRTYGPNAWGLTASDGPFGYKAWGAPPGWAEHNGTLAPTGCGASIVFTPELSIACLRNYYEKFGDRLWGNYGFSDAFNLEHDWFDHDVIGIDQGALFLMIENYRTGMIWDVMSKNKIIQNTMKAVGFREGTMELPWPDPPKYKVPYVEGGITVDGYLRDWAHSEAIILNAQSKESGQLTDDKDLKGEIRFAWDETALYFSAKVTDESILTRKTSRHIWKDDTLELFVDPEGDGLIWQNENDFQIGVRAEGETGGTKTWSWFQNRGEDPSKTGMIVARSYVDENGYILEGAIRWSYLNVSPLKDFQLRLSPAIHDIDRDRSEGKTVWHFRNEEEHQRFSLGTLVLA